MYWILAVMAGLAAVALALIVGGLTTPADHEVTRSVLLSASPGRVWDVVRDVERYATWRADVRESVFVDAEQPQVRWRETSRRGSMTLRIEDEHAPHRFTMRVLDEDLGFSGAWKWQIAAEASGTRVRITESATVSNLAFRFLGAHVFGHTRTIDALLTALARHLGSDGAPITDATE